jgi:hypothetical protein
MTVKKVNESVECLVFRQTAKIFYIFILCSFKAKFKPKSFSDVKDIFLFFFCCCTEIRFRRKPLYFSKFLKSK